MVKDTDDFGTNGVNDFEKFKSSGNGAEVSSNTNPLSSGNGTGAG